MGQNKVKKLVALACSTGGPSALHKLIPMLPETIGAPIVIVQHMPKGFTKSLAFRLNEESKLKVVEVSDGETLCNDVVYIAPGGRHLEIIEDAKGQLLAKVYDGPPVNNLKPCADVMYKSLLNISMEEILCVVLTGMGYDATEGIKSLKEKKKVYSITECQDSCVVYGMPKSMVKHGLSDEALPITDIANAIIKKLGD